MGAKEKMNDNKGSLGTSLEVWWLRLCLPMRGGVGSIPGWGTQVLHATKPTKGNKTEAIL